MMALLRTQFALSNVEEHLRDTGGGPAVETYLVQYLVVSLYSEMEEKVAEVIRSRLSFQGDKKLETFVFQTNESMIKRVKKSEISDVLQKFGCAKDDILADVSEAEMAIYSSAIANRHHVAHRQGASITLLQFKQALDAAEKIIVSIEGCIK